MFVTPQIVSCLAIEVHFFTDYTNQCTQFYVLIYKNPTHFDPHCPIIRECSFTKQLLAILSSSIYVTVVRSSACDLQR